MAALLVLLLNGAFPQPSCLCDYYHFVCHAGTSLGIFFFLSTESPKNLRFLGCFLRTTCRLLFYAFLSFLFFCPFCPALPPMHILAPHCLCWAACLQHARFRLRFRSAQNVHFDGATATATGTPCRTRCPQPQPMANRHRPPPTKTVRWSWSKRRDESHEQQGCQHWV